MEYEVIVVGGGIAGLTSAAYLSKAGYKVLLCEKDNKVGGLVKSFEFNGFIFDAGIRAIENSGIVFPMLRQLGVEVELCKNDVSIGVEEKIVKLTSKDSLIQYKNLLIDKFPNNIDDIDKIIEEIKKIMKYMDILYGIDNPIFLDIKNNKTYVDKTILPWLFKCMMTINKIMKLNMPVYEYLSKFTKNKSLIDMIAQHFFEETPTFFALSYFRLYLEYKYPKGGTASLVKNIEKLIADNKGDIKTDTTIKYINSDRKIIRDSTGNEYGYNKLIWAADLSSLYNDLDLNNMTNSKVKSKIIDKRKNIEHKKGGDSILTLYLTVDLDKSYFENKCTGHLFYTATKKGLNSLDIDEIPIVSSDKEDIINWVKEYYKLTTYEISIPVMRDETLAPKGKSGVIISTLMDYSLVKYIEGSGWYEEFKNISENIIIDLLNNSIFKDIKNFVIDKFTSTPVTIEKITGNLHGAITGWAFTNKAIPVENKMSKVIKAIDTPIPDILQVGQWTFSPSGLPISILTGKLAADKIIREK